MTVTTGWLWAHPRPTLFLATPKGRNIRPPLSPRQSMNAAPARACGIDFGTSNSTVGWLRPDVPALLSLEDGKPTLE